MGQLRFFSSVEYDWTKDETFDKNRWQNGKQQCPPPNSHYTPPKTGTFNQVQNGCHQRVLDVTVMHSNAVFVNWWWMRDRDNTTQRRKPISIQSTLYRDDRKIP